LDHQAAASGCIQSGYRHPLQKTLSNVLRAQVKVRKRFKKGLTVATYIDMACARQKTNAID